MSDVEGADDATAMAAAMGFSSFGAQQPNKRRKFNPNTDAFVAPDSSSTSTSALPFHRYNQDGGHFATTGSNMIPLGARKQNVDEIDLGDDEDGIHNAPTGQITRPSAADDEEDFEPQYLDTSRPSAPVIADSADSLQTRIDDIVSGSKEAYIPPQLPSNPPAGAGYPSRGGHGGRQRNNQSGTKWWEDYYDPAFITNPWDNLEKSHGLEPRGTWISWEEAKAAKTAQT
ncbi:hypothetical protein F5Y08DRAFT_112186 [Xylaria arbuscula]|uniref:Uncharacterized protein n=1 Tax=Xylaria arbuscula TaxID=114810 RepID=A0A9W8NBS9_9PEZI|nr:hypothetical protein F5Y08DRAFT_112186 [Xylaria arbuscula]KAJ3566788.1 hypothetical protein NPX13_g7003 [Xylaria arbuscula]